jgi:hypothetical protein
MEAEMKNKMTGLLPIMMGVIVACGSASGGEENRPRSIVGAIRWDAWHGDAEGPASPGMAVERSLGPKHWHYRLPFYAKVVGENKVEARANTQAIMDQEITYASNAQLDYWAFLTYNPKSSMSIGMQLYLSSPLKAKVKFCVICHHIRETPEEIERLVGYMKDPQYVRVLGDRSLVYVFQCDAQKAFFDALTKAVEAAGLKRPYLVNMGNTKAGIGFDAVSSYVGTDRNAWNTSKNKGVKVIPSISTGGDRSPRVENPVPWEGGGAGKPVVVGPLDPPEKTAANIAGRVASALEWNRANPNAGEANAVIIYAWNEFDEGGWLCPTLSEGTGRLDAIHRVLTAAEKQAVQPKPEGDGLKPAP